MQIENETWRMSQREAAEDDANDWISRYVPEYGSDIAIWGSDSESDIEG